MWYANASYLYNLFHFGKHCFIWFTTTHSDIHFFSLQKKKFKAIISKEILGQYPFTAVDSKILHIP